MKAWVLHEINEIRLEDRETPKPKNQEVLVKVRAAGICGSDIPRIYETGAHVHPIIPGHEFSGEVVALGQRAGKEWLGKRVGIFPLIPCGKCRPCREKHFEMCKNYSYLGSRTDGGFAEYVVVPETNLMELPEMVSFEEAAMLEPMAVAVHAITKLFGNLSEVNRELLSHSVVVYGLGTIGLFIVMFLKNLGFKKVFAVGNKTYQKEKVLPLGIEASFFIDAKSVDVSKEILEQTDRYGADFVFECVGKNDTIQKAIEILAPMGKACVVGNPYGDIILPRDIYWKILRNQCQIIGTWNSSFTHEANDDWHYVIEQFAGGKIAPEQMITHRFGLEELEKGLHIMRDKREEYIKMIVTNE